MIKVDLSADYIASMFITGKTINPIMVEKGLPEDAQLVGIEQSHYIPGNYTAIFDDGREKLTELTVTFRHFDYTFPKGEIHQTFLDAAKVLVLDHDLDELRSAKAFIPSHQYPAGFRSDSDEVGALVTFDSTTPFQTVSRWHMRFYRMVVQKLYQIPKDVFPGM